MLFSLVYIDGDRGGGKYNIATVTIEWVMNNGRETNATQRSHRLRHLPTISHVIVFIKINLHDLGVLDYDTYIAMYFGMHAHCLNSNSHCELTHFTRTVVQDGK